MDIPKVSVIVPSYKRNEIMFSRAITSLLNQDYKNLEIVVVDDNAKPEHQQYRNELKSYIEAINAPNIVYVENITNLGGSLSRNAGISASTGEYITFLDDDDRYLPSKVSKQLRYLIDNELDMVFGDLILYNEEDKVIDCRFHKDIKKFDNDYLRKYHLTKQITGTPTFMMKKNLLDRIGGFDDVKMGQEYRLMMKIIDSGAKIGYTPWCDIVAYRTKAEAISTGKNKISGEIELYAYKKKHFKLLSLWSRSYVRCRHYAVMAVAYKRNKIYGKAISSLFMSVIANPLIVISEGFTFIFRVLTRR